MYTATTHQIKITVNPAYLEAQSTAESHHFVWAYRVTIENQSSQTVQLLNRYWHITDALGRVQEVHGSGVVGEHPVLTPGQVFEYSSGIQLATPSGIIHGHYGMVGEGSTPLQVTIPAFSLDVPNVPVRLH